MIDAALVIGAARDRRALEPELIWSWVHAIVEGQVPDYQIAAWLMAVALNGLDDESVFTLTRAMAEIGTEPLTLRGLVDKHSTGGVGDKTTLILAPIVSSLGIPIVKMSGRGLGHTGGTLDKLESIPGFRIHLNQEDLSRQLDAMGLAVVAQSSTLAPADGILYALRDVTETVDSLPLIASSIMSKKIAAGSPNLVLDVKVGSGALMKNANRARQLADMMVRIGGYHHIRTTAVLSSMEQPLGRAVGNALEVNEAYACLCGRGPDDLREEVLVLAQEMVALAREVSADQSRALAEQALDSGAAREQFLRWIDAQGGDAKAVEYGLPVAARTPVLSRAEGRVGAIDTAAVGRAAQLLGAGRKTKEDRVNPRVGLEWEARLGDTVHPGDVLAWLYADQAEAAEAVEHIIQGAVTIGAEDVVPPFPTEIRRMHD
jgi:pyrimidine-nucleoside phosphorylase